MPELPDVTIYVEALRGLIMGHVLERVCNKSPFLVRTVEPPIEAAEGKKVRGVERMGKRIVIGLDDELYLVIHLMIAGRFLWQPSDSNPRGRIVSAVLRFSSGALVVTEAGTKKRAALHLVCGAESCRALDPGGLEVLKADRSTFRERLCGRNRTLKRALTDPRTFSGIGNAYSDEILHAARLSPMKWTERLSEQEIDKLFAAARDTLSHWIDELRRTFAGRFPGRGQITAFRDGFAAHGRYGRPCPVCQTSIQRIRYADNETNYCPRCQTDGKVLADRSMSRLLKNDWPKTIEEWEEG